MKKHKLVAGYEEGTGDVVSSIVIPRYGSHCDNQAQCHVGTRLIGGTLRKSHKYLTIALYTGN